jgi:hypothetical protein
VLGGGSDRRRAVVEDDLSLAGLAASWIWDLPTGAAVVVAFGVLLVLAITGRAVLRPA